MSNFKLDLERLHSIFLGTSERCRGEGNSVAVCYQAIGFIDISFINNIFIFFKYNSHKDNFKSLFINILESELNMVFMYDGITFPNQLKVYETTINFCLIEDRFGYDQVKGESADMMLFDLGGPATSVNYTWEQYFYLYKKNLLNGFQLPLNTIVTVGF